MGAGLPLPGGRASERTLFAVCARLFRGAALRPLFVLALFCRSGGEKSAITDKLSYAYARKARGYLASMLQAAGESGKGPDGKERYGLFCTTETALTPLTELQSHPRGPPPIAPSSNGKTTDSDSVYRGSNPRGASTIPSIAVC